MPNQDEKVTLRTWVAVMGSMLGAFMAVLDIQITNASLREITGGISSTSVEASWVSTSYLIGEIVTIPLTAWLSRVFGLRWYLLGNVALFLLFSGLCGAAGELVGNNPVVNLRLLLNRNLAFASVVNFIMGAGLYGSVFLLPQYLEQVQQYSARQTGEYMILIGLPQLLIFPFVPRLMKTIDLRLIVFFGAVVFGASCFLNTHMAPLFGGPQFQLANVIRALGQPFTIVPCSQNAA
jgi:hypothetical protein